MPDETEVTIKQLQELIEMLRRAVDAGSESARRIDLLEKASIQTFDILTRLQDNQQRLLDTFEKQANAQNKLNEDLTSTVSQLLKEVARLKGGGGSGLIM